MKLRTILPLLIATCYLSACAAPVMAPTLTPPLPAASLPTDPPPPLPTATLAPTHTTAPRPTPTLAPTDTPALTATSAPTATLVETSLPGPAAFSGSVILAGDGKKPLATTIELRHPENFALVASLKSGSDGKFQAKALLSGSYDLWVLITTKPGPLGICTDVVPDGEGWQLGILFTGDKGMLMKDASLAKAQLLGANLNDPSLKILGYYAVLPGLRIAPGQANTLDLRLQCK
jgi:hypothetical protein